MNRILLLFVVASCVLAGVLEVYSALSGTDDAMLALPFIIAAIVSALVFYTTSNALLAKAWDEGYTKAIEDTRHAVSSKNSEAIGPHVDTNPYRKKVLK